MGMLPIARFCGVGRTVLTLAEFCWSSGKCCGDSAPGRVGNFHGGTALQKTCRIIRVQRNFLQTLIV